MKNVKNKLWLIFAMIALVGFAAISCDNGTTDNPNPGTNNPNPGTDTTDPTGINRFVKLTAEDFTILGAAPEDIFVAVYADEALTQLVGAGKTSGNVWTGEIENVPSNNKVYAVLIAKSTTGYYAPKVFPLELGAAAADESLSAPKAVSVAFGNVAAKTVSVSYDSFTINGATPAHSGIEYMKPVVGFYFEMPGMVDENDDPIAFDLGEVKGYYTASNVSMSVPDFGTLPFPIYYSAFAYAEGALNPTIKTFTTGGPDYASANWTVTVGEIVQTITGTVNLAAFDLGGSYTSTSVSIFTADGVFMGNGAVTSGSFSFFITSQNTAKAGYAMIIGTVSGGGTTVETIRYSTAFTIPAASDPNQSVGALSYDSNRKHPAVTFNLNGGNISGNTANITVPTGSNYQIDPRQFPEAVRIVHTLAGWNTKANGSGDAYGGQKTTADITVYAQWEFTPITVSFNVNGGQWRDGTNTALEKQTNTSGLISPLPTAPIRSGYRFDGWFTASNGTGTELTASTPVTTAMATVYAKWTADASKTTYTVTFNGNGGTWNGTATKATYTQTGETALMAESPTTGKIGTSANPPSGATLSATLSEGLYAGAGLCTFTGWNTAANGSGTAFTASTAVSGNITVYAQWQEPAQWSAYKYTVAGSGETFFNNARNYISSNAGNYILVLGSDVVITNNNTFAVEITNASSVMLVGAGSRRTISRTANGGFFDIYNASAKLTLDYNITLQGRAGNTHPLVHVSNNGNLVMNEGAIITGNTNTGSGNWGGGVYVDGGTFTMNGGTISGNASTYTYGGGGVNVRNGTFTMNGGTISGNTASSGGGVYVVGGANGNGTFIMNNGTISGNTASYGGGVCYGNTFTMNGGTISGNTASSSGGGVSSDGSNVTFTMNGGTISGNTAGSGGGVSIGSYGIFRLITGTIYGNTEANTSLRNTATNSGASLYVAYYSEGAQYNGTATYGPSGTGTNLTTSNTTIRVVNGILQ